MRVVFLGTPEIAVPPLRRLLNHSYKVSGVFTQPDRPSGRGQKTKPGAVKFFAQENGIPVFQPERIGSEENREIFQQMQPDFIIVAAYGQILPAWILKSARLVPLNIHFSLLPKYRGAAPTAYAILNGDSQSGISIMIMQEALDSGPVLMQRTLPIPLNVTTGEMEIELAEMGSDLLIETMKRLLEGSIQPVPQEETLVSWAPRIIKENARIQWTENAMKIHNRIRAMNPWPGAFTIFRKEILHIWSSLPAAGTTVDGEIPGTFLGLTQNGLLVQCGDGTVLEILELQKPSKRRVSGREFASGVRLNSSDPLF